MSKRFKFTQWGMVEDSNGDWCEAPAVGVSPQPIDLDEAFIRGWGQGYTSLQGETAEDVAMYRARDLDVFKRNFRPASLSPVEPTPPSHDYSKCRGCGGKYAFDTVVPSVVWNEVIRAKGTPEFLCAACIIREFAKADQSFTAELWSAEFAGLPVGIHFNCRSARTSQRVSEENTDLRRRLRAAEDACKRLNDQLHREAGDQPSDLASSALLVSDVCHGPRLSPSVEPAPTPAPCVWRDIDKGIERAGTLFRAGCRDMWETTTHMAGWKVCPYCGSPLQVER